MNRLLGGFRANAAALAQAYVDDERWVEAWQRRAIWIRSDRDAGEWLAEVSERIANIGSRIRDQELADLLLPTVLEQSDVPPEHRRAGLIDLSSLWGNVHGHVYENPEDVFDDWRPIAMVSEQIIVVDKYAASLSCEMAGDATYAQKGLMRFLSFLDEISDSTERSTTLGLRFMLRFVTSKQGTSATNNKRFKELRGYGASAVERLNMWKGDFGKSVDIDVVILDEEEVGVGPMHDRFIQFIGKGAKWNFALGRGISAFANRESPLTVALVSEIPARWVSW